MQEQNERSKPGDCSVENPWSRQFWNLAEQGQIFKRDKDKADRLARAAGHKDAMTARIANAK